MRKRKHRGSRGRGYLRFHSGNVKKTGVNFLSVLVIMGLSVVLGFLTTKYVVYPLLLGEEASFDGVLGRIGISDGQKKETVQEDLENGADSQETAGAEERTEKSGNAAEKAQEDAPGGGASGTGASEKDRFEGYAIQFGSFSTEQAANTLLQELSSSGISASVHEEGGMFKVIGPVFPNAERAAAEKAKLAAACGGRYWDAFVTKASSAE